jgi:DNA (cytosine-5)-methyltransferase 1
VAFATDIEALCERSHSTNFPETPFFCGSIEAVTRGVLSEQLGPGFGAVDLLAGGPPCPPFSKSRFYRKEKPRGLDDAVGSNTLGGFMRILEELRPRVFLLENVPGLAYKVHSAALDMLLESANRLGYTCSYRILNAADYGVPQIRERLFLVGTRERVPFEFPEATHCRRESGDLFSSSLRSWRTAGEVLNDLDTDVDDDAGHKAGGKHQDLLQLVPPGDNYLFFTEERGHPKPLFRWRSRYWSFLLKLSPDLPSWTIQARRSNNMGPFHWRSRILRINEVKRLQGFPDKWFLAGNVEQQWRQIGNAVPPPLAAALGAALKRHLEQSDERGTDTRKPGRKAVETPQPERILSGTGRGTASSSARRRHARRPAPTGA